MYLTDLNQPRTIAYTTDIEAVNMGLRARGLPYDRIIDRTLTMADLKEDTPVEAPEDEYVEYECTCCYSFSEGHMPHCGTWLNED